jgi:hypothetical protein
VRGNRPIDQAEAPRVSLPRPNTATLPFASTLNVEQGDNGKRPIHSRQVPPDQLKLGMLFPPQSNIPEVEIQTAARVAKLVFDAGLARVDRPDDMEAFIRRHVYKPEYQPLA